MSPDPRSKVNTSIALGAEFTAFIKSVRKGVSRSAA